MTKAADRAVALFICGFGLAACGSVTVPGFDSLTPKPTTTGLLVESSPGGAEARSSLGATCRTPCTMQIGTAGDFTISFVLDGYLAQTATVHSTMSKGDFMTAPAPLLNPTPIFVTLEPDPSRANPQKRPPKKSSRPASGAPSAQQ
jgi:hypothetical protein